ncbi:MAG: alkaline phosphatase family protein [Candidatus Sericytochromatia bacterium]|nr:alkaline phosphatase family protein [Candidatus Tanganyikabacteria bacterium]
MHAPPLLLNLLDGWPPFGPRPWDEQPDRTPHLALLARHGHHGLAVTTFPGVTPTALASPMTGEWPDKHGIPGILWYHRKEDRHVHYWPSWEQAKARRMARVARDILMDLNGRHLNPGIPTLFDRLEDQGVRCAVANLPIHRGPVAHGGRLSFPLDPLLHRGPVIVMGPTDLTLAGFRKRSMSGSGMPGEGRAVAAAAA